MAEYTLLEDATNENAKYRIVDDSYDYPHPNNTTTAGINNLIVQCGIPWNDRWIVYEIYTAAARKEVMDAIYNTLLAGDRISIRGTVYFMTGCDCTDAIFTDDLATSPPVKSWKYRMTFVR